MSKKPMRFQSLFQEISDGNEDQDKKQKDNQQKQKVQQGKENDNQESQSEHQVQQTIPFEQQIFRPTSQQQLDNHTCFHSGTNKYIDDILVYECLDFNNIIDEQKRSKLKSTSQTQLRKILSKFRQSNRLDELEQYIGCTKEVLSSICLELLLNKVFNQPWNKKTVNGWAKEDTNRTKQLTQDHFFKFDMHDQLSPGEVKQLIIRFLIRFNTKYRKPGNVYMGPVYIMLIPGEGEGYIKHRTQQVLSDQKLQIMQLYQMSNLVKINSSKVIVKGSILIKPKQK